MGKRKHGNRDPKARANEVAPEFRRHINENYGDITDLSGAPDEMRLSDCLLRLTEPYRESEDLVFLLDCATIAWNECLDEDDGIKESYSLNNVLVNFARHRELIDALKARKRMMFAGNRRHIVEVKVYQKGDNLSVNVASDVYIRAALSDAFLKLRDMIPALDAEPDDEEIPE